MKFSFISKNEKRIHSHRPAARIRKDQARGFHLARSRCIARVRGTLTRYTSTFIYYQLSLSFPTRSPSRNFSSTSSRIFFPSLLFVRAASSHQREPVLFLPHSIFQLHLAAIPSSLASLSSISAISSLSPSLPVVLSHSRTIFLSRYIYVNSDNREISRSGGIDFPLFGATSRRVVPRRVAQITTARRLYECTNGKCGRGRTAVREKLRTPHVSRRELLRAAPAGFVNPPLSSIGRCQTIEALSRHYVIT